MVTSKPVNIVWWNLVVGALYKNLGRIWILGHSFPGCAPPRCGVRLRRWENQCRLSSYLKSSAIALSWGAWFSSQSAPETVCRPSCARWENSQYSHRPSSWSCRGDLQDGEGTQRKCWEDSILALPALRRSDLQGHSMSLVIVLLQRSHVISYLCMIATMFSLCNLVISVIRGVCVPSLFGMGNITFHLKVCILYNIL